MNGDPPTANTSSAPDIDLTRKTKAKDPLVGTVLDNRFEIEEVLGTGGMSVVYKAKQLRVNRHVAIKTIRMQLDSKPVYRERFQREISSLFSLSHPNIVTVHDFLIGPDEQPYVVMDYLRGRPLDELIKNEGPLTIERFARISVQICSALDHAHKRGIVHRDLKPSNVVLLDNENDFVKVVDFGLAKLSEDNRKLTQSGELWGSPPYMSPEQCTGGGGDARSDIYSLGACMYEMLCGKDPFWYAATIFELIQRHVSTVPAPLHEQTEGLVVPAAIEACVFKALEKDPLARYQSAQEFQEAIVEACSTDSGSGNLRLHASVSPKSSAERTIPMVSNPQGEDLGQSQQANWFAGMLMAADDPVSNEVGTSTAPSNDSGTNQFADQDYRATGSGTSSSASSRWSRPDAPGSGQTGMQRAPSQSEIAPPAPTDRGQTSSPSTQAPEWTPDLLDNIRVSNVHAAPQATAGAHGEGSHQSGTQSRLSSTIDGATAYNSGANVGGLRSAMPYDNDQFRAWMPVIAVICIAVGFACAFAIFNSMKNSTTANNAQTAPVSNSGETSTASGTDAGNSSDANDGSPDSDKTTPVTKRSTATSSQENAPKRLKVSRLKKPRVAKPAETRTPSKPKPRGTGGGTKDRWDDLRNLQ